MNTFNLEIWNKEKFLKYPNSEGLQQSSHQSSGDRKEMDLMTWDFPFSPISINYGFPGFKLILKIITTLL